MNIYTINAKLSNTALTVISSTDTDITLTIKAENEEQAILIAENIVEKEPVFFLLDPWISQVEPDTTIPTPSSNYVSMAQVIANQNSPEASYSPLTSTSTSNSYNPLT